jgi:hypothetical protein
MGWKNSTCSELLKNSFDACHPFLLTPSLSEDVDPALQHVSRTHGFCEAPNLLNGHSPSSRYQCAFCTTLASASDKDAPHLINALGNYLAEAKDRQALQKEIERIGCLETLERWQELLCE